MEFVNAAVLVKLASSLSEDDQPLLERLTKAHEVFAELRSKHIDYDPAKNENLIRDFHTYKLGETETIEHAWSELKSLAREIIANNDLL